jgi:hypothetical protein
VPRIIRTPTIGIKTIEKLIASLPIALAVGCQPAGEPQFDPADLVLSNGMIYTVDRASPWAEAVAITDGRFVAVGANDDIARFVGEDTVVTDLDGRMRSSTTAVFRSRRLSTRSSPTSQSALPRRRRASGYAAANGVSRSQRSTIRSTRRSSTPWHRGIRSI